MDIFYNKPIHWAYFPTIAKTKCMFELRLASRQLYQYYGLVMAGDSILLNFGVLPLKLDLVFV